MLILRHDKKLNENFMFGGYKIDERKYLVRI